LRVPSSVDRVDRLALRLDRQRGRGVDDHVGPLDEPGDVGGRANVPAKLLHLGLEGGVVERRQVERAHHVPVRDEAAGEVQPEETGAAGDGPSGHGCQAIRGRRGP